MVVAVVGAGAIGRRIALMHAAAGTRVRLYDAASSHAESARDWIRSESPDAEVEVAGDLAAAVRGAWLVVEAVPEDLELKRRLFGELDRLADPGAILASNSSSIPSSRLLAHVSRPERVLNAHYQWPPAHIAVELMSSGHTEEAIFERLEGELRRVGLQPFRVRKESDGFIFNRIWAAIKRECLLVVDEGVATPEEVDRMWRLWTGSSDAPFALMDQVGLDVVLAVEEHYAEVRADLPEGPRRLLRELIDAGRLGEKSGRGFFSH